MNAPTPVTEQPEFIDCPPTPVRAIHINGKALAIEEDNISLIREISPEQRRHYLKTNHVPLKDFSKFMQSLSKELKGQLSEIQDRKLRKLILPVMVPAATALSQIPDEDASIIVVISNGRWHGVLCCSAVGNGSDKMVKFKKAKNGDIAGVGFLNNGEEIQILNAASLLAREGFLAIT